MAFLHSLARSLAMRLLAQIALMLLVLLQPSGACAESSGSCQSSDCTKRPLIIGFHAAWDPHSFASLKTALPQLDWIVPSWLTLDGNLAVRSAIQTDVLDYVRPAKPSAKILPMLQNFHDGVWDGNRVAQLVADPERRTRTVSVLLQFVTRHRLHGVVIDFENIPADAHRDFVALLTELRNAFSRHQLIVAVAVPFDSPDWDYPVYAGASDFLMLMAYDQHWETSAPGPIAAQNWFRSILARRLNALDPARTILCLGNYGYDWAKGKPAEVVTVREATNKAQRFGGSVALDAASSNPYLSYADDHGVEHHLWFLDAQTVRNQLRESLAYHPAGYALWRLGSEDPAVWEIFRTINLSGGTSRRRSEPDH